MKEMVLRNDQTQLFYWPFNSHFKIKRDGRYAKDEIWIKQWTRTDKSESVKPGRKLYRAVRKYIVCTLGSCAIKFMAVNPKSVRMISSACHKVLRRPGEEVLAVPDAIHYMCNLDAAIVVGFECVFKVDEGFERPCKAWTYSIDKVSTLHCANFYSSREATIAFLTQWCMPNAQLDARICCSRRIPGEHDYGYALYQVV